MSPINSYFCRLSNQWLNNNSISFRKVWRKRSILILYSKLKRCNCIYSWEVFLLGRIKCCCCEGCYSIFVGKLILLSCNLCMSFISLKDCILCRNRHCDLERNIYISYHKIFKSYCSCISYILLSRLGWTCFIKGCSCNS